ncbi:hypothetical protein MWU59_10450 [Flavobacteriaceae bacterium F08102]|nr:hypothetical protein [Flavobacteriaceae bacterium F08102]
MKITLTKIGILFTLVTLSIFTYSCKDEESVIPPEEANKIKFSEEISFYNPSITNSNGLVKGTITGVFDNTLEEVSSFQLSSSILNALNINQKDFERKLNEKLTQKSAAGDHNDCMEACKDKYTNEDGSKIKGRGGCKFSCWVDTVIQLAEILAPILK